MFLVSVLLVWEEEGKENSNLEPLKQQKKGPWSTARHSRDFLQLFVRRPLTFSSSSLAIVAFVPFLCSLCVCMSIHSLYGVKVYVSIFFSIFFTSFVVFADRGKL